MPKVPVSGIELYYESTGEGPAVLFAHGRGGNHLSWWQQVPVFSRNYRCVTFDHRGFGQSLNPPTEPGRDAFVDDLRDLLDHLGIDSAFLVAQSMGGLTCLGFALEYPHRVKGLVLGDTTGGIGEDSVVDVIVNRKAPDDTMLRAVSPGFRDRDPAKAFLYREINLMNPPKELEPNGFTSGEGPKAQELSGMRVPTLLIVGSEDVVMPPAAMELSHKLIPGSRLEVVDGAGHSVYFEKPDIFNRLVLDFFAGIQSGE
ncbi:MAG: alpha/beta hydrolase [Dehalococcoidia bacterium]|nr:alpha/beta hydrolase [Dehalococcoidia bacterium]